MKDPRFFTYDNLYALFLLLSMLFVMFAMGICETKAFDTTRPIPRAVDLWNVSLDELSINHVCRYLVENGWVSENVDEETFHYEVTMIMQLSDQFDNVTPGFALALAANESRFRPDALSQRGARGLFQMLPSYHSDRLIQYMEEDEPYSDDCFYDPLLNIMAGMDYLNYILGKVDGLRVLGEVDGLRTAAVMWYNEGPTRGMSRFEQGIVSPYAKKVCALSEEIDNILCRYEPRPLDIYVT